MDTTIPDRINLLREDRTHGAGWLSTYALNTLNLAIESSKIANSTDFMNEMRGVFFKLAESRPNIVSIANITYQLISYLSKLAYKEKTVKELKRIALDEGNEILKRTDNSFIKTAQNVVAAINSGDIIITCSYSSLVCKSMKLAKEKGKAISVTVLKSVNSGIAYGELVSRELTGYGIHNEIIEDNDIENNITGVSRLITGADTISLHGYFINGSPTRKLAELVSNTKIPFLVACETHKFDIYGFHKKNLQLEQGFDKIPLNLINGIITELGLIKPDQLDFYAEMLKST